MYTSCPEVVVSAIVCSVVEGLLGLRSVWWLLSTEAGYFFPGGSWRGRLWVAARVGVALGRSRCHEGPLRPAEQAPFESGGVTRPNS